MKNEVLKFAESQVGKQEISGNNGFKDKFLDMVMRRVGFQNGWAWCALFAEACWSYPTYEGKSKVIATISDCFSANAVRTYENFKKDQDENFEVGKDPMPGSVVIWEKRRNGDPVKTGVWTIGHAGIVKEVHEDHFIAIEGNTNSHGGREGIEIAVKKRAFNYYDKNGLCLVGFITPKI